MATKFAHDLPEEADDLTTGPGPVPPRYGFGHATVRFLGAAMPAVSLALALAYVMS